MKGYINFREENSHRHEANILISSNRQKRFNGKFDIEVVIESSSSYVFIEGDENFKKDFKCTYTFYHKFNLIGGTLLIQATDNFEEVIEIAITGV